MDPADARPDAGDLPLDPVGGLLVPAELDEVCRRVDREEDHEPELAAVEVARLDAGDRDGKRLVHVATLLEDGPKVGMRARDLDRVAGRDRDRQRLAEE